MKKGFTLIELLCVIVIIGLLLVFAIPSITNIINGEKDNISDSMKNLITQSGELYVQDNSGMYKKTEGNVYCITLRELIDAERLQDPLKDPISGDEIDTNKYLKVLVENGNYKYELSNSCTQVENTGKVCRVTEGTGSNIGDVITCGTESFYVYDTTGDNIKMLAMYNLEVGNNTNSYYPATTETNMQSANALGYQYGATTNYATIAFSTTGHQGVNGTSYEGSLAKEYVDAYATILENMGVNVINASLITTEELETIGCSLNNRTCITAPEFIRKTSYWSSSASSDTDSWVIVSDSSFTLFSYVDYFNFGVRPVITVLKSDIKY